MTPDLDLRRRAEQEIERAEACVPPFTRLADLLRDLLALVADQAQQIAALEAALQQLGNVIAGIPK